MLNGAFCPMGRNALLVVVAGFFLVAVGKEARAQNAGIPTDSIPHAVMKALHSRFPGAQIQKWTREKDNGQVIYDLEVRQDSRKAEADITPKGTYVNFEVEVSAQKLPEAVMEVVKTEYPAASLHEILRITAVKEGKEKLQGYEVVVQTNAGKRAELTVGPDGEILERESGGEG